MVSAALLRFSSQFVIRLRRTDATKVENIRKRFVALTLTLSPRRGDLEEAGKSSFLWVKCALGPVTS